MSFTFRKVWVIFLSSDCHEKTFTAVILFLPPWISFVESYLVISWRRGTYVKSLRTQRFVRFLSEVQSEKRNSAFPHTDEGHPGVLGVAGCVASSQTGGNKGRYDRQLGVPPLIPAWFYRCHDTPYANTSKRAVVQRSRSIGPVYQSAHPPAPSLSSQKHFFQVTACGQYLPAVKHSICLWHYEYMLTLKYRHRWTRRYLFFPLLVNCSLLDSNMLCNCDTFGPAIIHYITVMTSCCL